MVDHDWFFVDAVCLPVVCDPEESYDRISQHATLLQFFGARTAHGSDSPFLAVAKTAEYVSLLSVLKLIASLGRADNAITARLFPVSSWLEETGSCFLLSRASRDSGCSFLRSVANRRVAWKVRAAMSK